MPSSTTTPTRVTIPSRADSDILIREWLHSASLDPVYGKNIQRDLLALYLEPLGARRVREVMVFPADPSRDAFGLIWYTFAYAPEGERAVPSPGLWASVDGVPWLMDMWVSPSIRYSLPPGYKVRLVVEHALASGLVPEGERVYFINQKTGRMGSAIARGRQ